MYKHLRLSFWEEMYAETGMMFPCFHNFSPEIYNLDHFYEQQKPIHSLSNQDDIGAESDLFQAPELIPEEPNMSLDPMAAAIALMNSGEDLHQPLFSDAFYECRKDLLAKTAIAPPADVQESDVFLQKSVSSGCLSSSFMEFPGVDFGDTVGMRRAFSEGDMKILSSDQVISVESLVQTPVCGVSRSRAEERRQQLCRYRNKKRKRNFGRKIKYACRKALADSQPRIRGRFAKTEDQNG